MNQHHQHQQHQHQQHENNINNHNHHHYFVDGIGDGNQQDHFFDLPNNNVNSHSFIRKKGIDELYNQHQHHNQHHNQQQQQKQQQKHASDKDEMKQKTEEIEGGKHHDNIILHAKDIRTPTIPSHHNTIKKINPPSVTTTITATITPTPDHHQNHEPLSDQIQDGQGNLHSSSIGIIFGIVGMCLVVNYFMTTYIGNNNNKDDKKRHKKLYYDRNIIQYIIPSVLFQRFYNCKIKKPKNTQKKKTDEWTNDDDEGGRLRDDIGMMEDEEDIAIAEKNNTCCGDSSIKDNIITAISGAGAAVSTKNNESIMYATRSHEYSPDIHYRKRTIIHHKNNKNNNNDYLEFGGGGLDGFDVNIGGGNHHQQQQQQLHRRRSKANAQQQQRFILPTYEYNSHNINQQQYHHRDRVDSHTFSSTSSSSSSKSYNKNTKEEDEWDQLSSQSFSSVSSSHMDSPTKSVMNEYVDHDGDNDGCQGMNNVNNKNNNHDENDVEMPTPRIENRESSQLTQHDAHTRPMMTSYSAFNIPSLPSLECNLTNDDDEDIVDVKNTGTINASAMNERKLTLPPPPPPPPLQQHQQLQSNPGNLQTDRNQPRPPLVNPIVGSNKASFTTATTPAPRSISIEELKLIRMETGMISGGKNHTNEKSNKSMIHVTVDATASFSKRQSIVEPQDSNYMSEPMSSPPICNMARSNCESDKNMCKSHNERNIEEGGGINSMNKLKALATPMKVKETRIPNDNDDGDGENDNDNDNNDSLGVTEGANGILHKRKNLTSSSDAASSLTSPIPFSELKMKELIGGGGFGQVWSASWRGTPVAVKVLSVAHKVEHIQRAILQEFAAEINLVSGMRHPNICLYIGACLEPSNRAIVTGKLFYSISPLFFKILLHNNMYLATVKHVHSLSHIMQNLHQMVHFGML
jgi:hypothetical protein